MNSNIRRDFRVCFTKLRLNNHNFLIECARWLKVKVPYTQRTSTLCNSNDIEVMISVTYCLAKSRYFLYYFIIYIYVYICMYFLY